MTTKCEVSPMTSLIERIEVAAPFGGSARTGTLPALISTIATTAPINMRISGSGDCLLAPAKKLSCAHLAETPCLFGDDLSMTAVNAASTARRFGMKGAPCRQSLSDRLMPLLISSGRVRGIIPTSIRRGSDQLTLGPAFYTQAGGGAAKQRVACTSSPESLVADAGDVVALRARAAQGEG